MVKLLKVRFFVEVKRIIFTATLLLSQVFFPYIQGYLSYAYIYGQEFPIFLLGDKHVDGFAQAEIEQVKAIEEALQERGGQRMHILIEDKDHLSDNLLPYPNPTCGILPGFVRHLQQKVATENHNVQNCDIRNKSGLVYDLFCWERFPDIRSYVAHSPNLLKVTFQDVLDEIDFHFSTLHTNAKRQEHNRFVQALYVESLANAERFYERFRDCLRAKNIELFSSVVTVAYNLFFDDLKDFASSSDYAPEIEEQRKYFEEIFDELLGTSEGEGAPGLSDRLDVLQDGLLPLFERVTVGGRRYTQQAIFQSRQYSIFEAICKTMDILMDLSIFNVLMVDQTTNTVLVIAGAEHIRNIARLLDRAGLRCCAEYRGAPCLSSSDIVACLGRD